MNATRSRVAERRVLIVSDGGSAGALRIGFAREGSVAISSTSFKEARERLFAERFDLLVTDVRLGAFNGLHLAIVARYERPEMQVVVVSDVDDPVLRQEAGNVGARYIVTLPTSTSAARSAAEPSRKTPVCTRPDGRRCRKPRKRLLVRLH